MRIRSYDVKRCHIQYNHQPFSGTGASLYVTVGGTVRYRNLRIVGNKFIETSEFDIGASSVTKTTRITSASSPLTQLTTAVDSDWYSQTISIDVRRYADHVESTNSNYRTAQLTLDGSGNTTSSIYGTATLISVQKRDAGVCRITFSFEQSLSGVEALTLTAIRTAGPTSPANAAVSAGSGRQVYQIDTPTLSDSAPYTYKIQAANGGTTADVLTGITVTADATGPSAPTGSGTDW